MQADYYSGNRHRQDANTCSRGDFNATECEGLKLAEAAFTALWRVERMVTSVMKDRSKCEVSPERARRISLLTSTNAETVQG